MLDKNLKNSLADSLCEHREEKRKEKREGKKGAAVFSRRRGLSPCGGQSAGTALMLVDCAVRRKLAYVSTVQTSDIKTRRVCPPQGVFSVFVIFVRFVLFVFDLKSVFSVLSVGDLNILVSFQ